MHDLRDDAQVREHGETERPPPLLSKEALPLFAVFFLWSFGNAALWLGRPLLAYELSGSAFAVGAAFALGGVPLLTTPLIGVLVDRLGRKQVVVAGAVLHGGAAAMQGFADSYLVFMGLAFISGSGSAAWLTGSTTLLADFTRVANRGRGIALRYVTVGLGLIAGPAVGGAVAAAFDVSAVLAFGAATRVPIVVLVWFLIRETRPAPSSAPEAGEFPRRLRPDVSLFMTRSFLVLTAVMLVLGLTATGHFEHQALFLDDAGLDPTQIGLALSIIGFVGLLIAMPVGSLVDSWGRRLVLATGLVILGAAALLTPWLDGRLVLLALLGVFAVGKLMTGIALETHAMDLAPRERRGYFLGTWLLVKDLIEGAAALLVGAAFLLPGALGIGVVGLVLLGMAAFLAVSRQPRP